MTSGGDNSFTISEKSKQRMSDAWTQDRKDALGNRNKEWWDSLSEKEYDDWCQKLADNWTDSRRKIISSSMKNRWNSLSDEERTLICKQISKNHHDVSGDKNPKSKKVKCIETNEIFSTAKEVSTIFDINYSTLKGHLQGRLKQAKGYHFEYLT